ncbi:hypothetical protein HYT05_02110 [Candidatus Kaiserbacteria bacterium]|nr:hypothetical protein [Candidatus Kaiserbacteria bacterium]
MKIIIEKGDRLPVGEYELTNPQKLERAKATLASGASDRMVLVEYDKIGGRIVKDHVVLSAQSLWNIEQKHMNKPIEQFTDEELLVVIRRAENSNIPGSLYQRANNEWKLRQDQKLLNAAKREMWSSERVPIGYPMSCSSDQIRNVIQDLSDEKRKKLQNGKNNVIWEKIIDDLIKSGQAELAERRETRRWYEKPLGLVLIGVTITVIAAGIAFLLHWN